MKNERLFKRLKYQSVFAVFALICLASVVRFPYLNLNLRGDESLTFQDYAKEPVAFIATHYFKPNNHIFHNILVRGFTYVFGHHPEGKIRFVAFLAGVLSIPMFYFLSKRILGRRTVWPACLLMTVFPVLVLYSVNARGYALLVFFSIISFYASCRIHDSKTDAGRLKWNGKNIAWEGVSVFSNSLALWTVPTHLFYVLAEFMMLILGKGLQTKVKVAWMSARLALTGLLSFLFYLPLLIQENGFRQLTSNQYVAAKSLKTLPECYKTLLSSISSHYFDENIPFAVFFFSVVLLSIVCGRWFKNRFAGDFVACYFLVLLVFVSVRHRVPYVRTMIHFIPFAIIAFMQFLEFAYERTHARCRIKLLPAILFSLTVLAVLTGFFIPIEKTVHTDVQYDAEEIADVVERLVVENNAIVGTDYRFNHPLSYYLDGREGVSEGAARTFYPSDMKIEEIYLIRNLASAQFLMARTFLSMGLISPQADFETKQGKDGSQIIYERESKIFWRAETVGSILEKYPIVKLTANRPVSQRYKMLHRYFF